MAMKDVPNVRDRALELLRDRQEHLTKEQSSRVRMRDAEDCEELQEALQEADDVATADTKRDLERMAREDCKRMLRQPALCERCRGAGPGPGGKGKGKKK
jgi:hypothetical protein